MPSNNGLFDVPDPTNFDRDWGQVIIVGNTSAPGWPANPTGWYYQVEASTTPGGPYAPATLTALADACTPMAGNQVPINPAQPDSTGFGVGGPGSGVTPGTDYWGLITLHDDTGAERDRFEIPADDPWTTRPYPTFTCFFTDTTTTGTNMHLGSSGDGRVNTHAPCDIDNVVWEYSLSASGPWTSTPPENVNGLSPSHTFTGLTPDTDYFAQAHVRDVNNVEYTLTGPCPFRTLADPVTTPSFDPQPCCDSAAAGGECMEPVQFHRTTTSTGPVDHPGRQYDITLPINPGFAVESMQVDSVTNAANITWEVDDPDGEKFRVALTTFMEGRLPAPAVVTITNPNAGQTICGTAAAMQIHIECLRLDQNPPNLIELLYNGGQDLILNPAYNENPPLNPPVAEGNYGYHLLARQDDPGPFPGNPPAGRVLCTNTANRGWETNDQGRTFEIWGKDVATGVTPTPRGTPVQEITSDGPPPGGRSTIWQTFQAPANADFIIKVAHGARDAGEQHKITLDFGDTDDAQNGTLINDVTTPAVVYGNPWTQFQQTLPLTSGQVYTLALSSTNPVAGARGGLFTDMRAYINRPGLRATATTDDETCVVSVEETTTNCADELWAPHCNNGDIDSWKNVATGQSLDNTAFWGQTPTPVPGPCPATTSGGEGGSVAANLAVSDLVCGIVGGVPTTLIRVSIMDASGGTLATQFLGPDGGPVVPDSWQPGSCTDSNYIQDVVLCDQLPGIQGTVSFIRKYVQYVDATGNGQVRSFRDYDFTGASYTVQGLVVSCDDAQTDQEPACWTDSNSTPGIHTGTIRHNDGYPTGWILFDQNTTLVGDTSGVTFVPCSNEPFATTGLCLADGTPIAVVTEPVNGGVTYSDVGWINLTTGAFSAGNPPAGTKSCSAPLEIQTSGVLCDVTTSTNTVNRLVLIQYNYNPDGSIASTTILDATTGDPYTPVGTITVCPTDTGTPDNDQQVLCDRQADGSLVPFVRDFRRDAVGTISGFTDYTLNGVPYTVTGIVQSCIPRDAETLVLCDSTGTRFLRTVVYGSGGTIQSFADTNLAGAPFTPTGAVSVCPAASTDSESFILCDSAAVPNRFIRTYTYTSAGAVAGFTDTTLAGAPFTPTGAVGACAQTVASDTDFVEEVLCDANGTSFIRLFRFNSATGALVSTTNTTLAGTAFTPVGVVGLCSNCCPTVAATGLCTNTGSGRGTSIRNANGTISLIDSVTGAAITAANIVPCVDDDTVRTLTAQHQLVVPGSPWTPPGAGVLTSLTYTILSGTGTVVDGDGTSVAGLPAGLTVTWNAEDDNTLLPPQSITSVGGQIYTHWTAR